MGASPSTLSPTLASRRFWLKCCSPIRAPFALQPPPPAQDLPDARPGLVESAPEAMAKWPAGALSSDIKGLQPLRAFPRTQSTFRARNWAVGWPTSSEAKKTFSKPSITKNIFLSAMPAERQNYLSILSFIIKFYNKWYYKIFTMWKSKRIKTNIQGKCALYMWVNQLNCNSNNDC